MFLSTIALHSIIPAKRKVTKDKKKSSGTKAPARRAQKPFSPTPRDKSSDPDGPWIPEVPQEDAPAPEECRDIVIGRSKERQEAFKLKDQEDEAMVIE